jgi:beta-glucosidase
VLLKNQGSCLPLGRQAKIAVVGPLASARAELMGSWVLDGVAEEVTSVVDGLRELAPRASILTAPPLLDAAVMTAQRADVTVLVLGESPLRTGEAHNIADLSLPRDQDAWVDALARTGTPLVVVICAGRPLPIAHVVANAQAVLYAWHPGTEGGRAIADVLLGAEVPGGRLPATLPRTQGQVPIFYAHKHGGRGVNRYYPFAKPDHPGIRPYLDDLGSPLFPFGFGLSYSTFAYDELVLDQRELARDGALKVSARLTNTGPFRADEVAQCYVRDFVASVTRPLRELRGFQRVTLAAGESARVDFELGPEDLAFWNNARQRVVEPGRFAVYVGGDSFAELGAEFLVR